MINKKSFYVIPIALVIVVGLTGLSCGKTATEKAAEKEIETATNGQADVDVSNNTVNVTTNQGSWQAGENVSLPTGFPDDVYVVDGNITAAFTTNETNGYTVSIETTQSVNDLQTLYDTELKADGWNITFSMAASGSATLGGQKDNRTVSVGISSGDEGKNMVVISTFETTN